MNPRIIRTKTIHHRLGKADLLFHQTSSADIYFTSHYFINGCSVCGIAEYFIDGSTRLHSFGSLEDGEAVDYIQEIYNNNLNKLKDQFHTDYWND